MAMGGTESQHHHNDSRDECLSRRRHYWVGRKRIFGDHTRAAVAAVLKIDLHSVALKINISTLDISADQLYAQPVSDIYSFLSLCQ
jgi:hypothetical protein